MIIVLTIMVWAISLYMAYSKGITDGGSCVIETMMEEHEKQGITSRTSSSKDQTPSEKSCPS